MWPSRQRRIWCWVGKTEEVIFFFYNVKVIAAGLVVAGVVWMRSVAKQQVDFFSLERESSDPLRSTEETDKLTSDLS